MASISERLYIQQGVEVDVRLDGRRRMDYRPFTIETDIVNNANGSARIRLDATEIVATVKAEVGVPDSSNPNSGRVVCAVNCAANIHSTMSSRDIDNYNTDLTSQLDRMLSQSGGLRQLSVLSIIPGKQCWVLNVDVLVLSSAGSVCDAMSLAAKTALRHTRLPRLTVVTEENGEADFEVSDDPYDTVPVNDSCVPIAVTLTKIGTQFVVDSCLEEELCTSACLTVMVTQDGKIAGMHKSGIGGLAPSALSEAVMVAHRMGVSLCAKLPGKSSSPPSSNTSNSMDTSEE